MNSNITDASQDELINLIYHHLKDSGYKKAANVLRKQAPQVQILITNIKRDQLKLFKFTGVRTPELKSPAKSKSGTKSKITAPSPPYKSHLTYSSLTPLHRNRRKKKLTKPRKRKKSVPQLATAAAGNDSDSDLSLDVEKWRKMVSQLSDADRVKMDVLLTLDESPVSSAKSSAKGRKTKKPARAQKEGNPAKKGKSTAKPDDIPVTTDASETPSKKSKDKYSVTPKRTKAKATNSSDNPEAHHEMNGLLETEVGVSDSEPNRTPNRVHFKKENSFSEQVETNVWKDNGTSETSSTETPSKKTKKKKSQSEASNVETDNSPLNIKEVKKAVKNARMDATSDQSETPSKKVKNKKPKSVVEPKADVSLESVKPDSSSKKGKLKASKRYLETVEPETPSKKSKAKKVKSTEVSGGEQTTSKKVKTAASDADLPQSDSTNSFSTKRKSKAADVVEIQNDTVDGDGLGNEETCSHDLKTPSKKRKHKREEACDVPAPEEATPEPKKAKKDKEKKKSKESENADALQPPAEEEEDASVPVEISQKKKINYLYCSFIVQKKKSSKEKQLSSVETHGLNST
uniref:Uncharacterized protein n=1 Tax=Sinocyclocheilus anshuiensis TaxID=1608454 RepID=A0A671RSK7_9TELE